MSASGAPVASSAVQPGWALHIAVLLGQTPTVQRLLAAGADVTATQQGWTAQQLAAYQGRTHIVQQLLAAGADAAAAALDGTTPPGAAFQAGHVDLCLQIASHIATDAGVEEGVRVLQQAVEHAGEATQGLVGALLRAWMADRAPKHALQQLKLDVQQLLIAVAAEHQQLRAVAAPAGSDRGVQAAEVADGVQAAPAAAAAEAAAEAAAAKEAAAKEAAARKAAAKEAAAKEAAEAAVAEAAEAAEAKAAAAAVGSTSAAVLTVVKGMLSQAFNPEVVEQMAARVLAQQDVQAALQTLESSAAAAAGGSGRKGKKEKQKRDPSNFNIAVSCVKAFAGSDVGVIQAMTALKLVPQQQQEQLMGLIQATRERLPPDASSQEIAAALPKNLDWQLLLEGPLKEARAATAAAAAAAGGTTATGSKRGAPAAAATTAGKAGKKQKQEAGAATAPAAGGKTVVRDPAAAAAAKAATTAAAQMLASAPAAAAAEAAAAGGEGSHKKHKHKEHKKDKEHKHKEHTKDKKDKKKHKHGDAA